MKRLLLCISVLLAGCSASPQATQTFTVAVDAQHTAHADALFEAGVRVVDRRLSSLQTTLLDHTLTKKDNNTAELTIAASDADALTKVTEDLMVPFSFALMLEAPEDQADITIMGQGGFKDAGITEEDLDWTVAETLPDGKARVELIFTAAGRKKLDTLYAANPGKALGMFVRGNLISKLIIDKGGLQEKIMISQIPSPEIAEAFSDDVNVGVGLTFTAAK